METATDAADIRHGRRPYAAAPDLHLPGRRARHADERAADVLGWLSIGLGVAALLAPRTVGRTVGIPARPRLVRAVGARELVSGAGLLTQRNRHLWLWSRVLGDAMDLGLIGTATARRRRGRRRWGLGALAVVGAIAAADVAVSLRHRRLARQAGHPLTGGHEAFFDQAVLVERSPQECYAFWRDLRNLPRFMPMLKTLILKDDRTSHWVVQAPGGSTLAWDVELTQDRPGECIAWRSLPGSAVKHSGSVTFESAPGARGCIVRKHVHYAPPLGRAGISVAKLTGHDPASVTREDMRRFKQLLETGEIPTTAGQPSGRRSTLGRLLPEGRRSRHGTILREARP